jgi:hypothetical protein
MASISTAIVAIVTHPQNRFTAFRTNIVLFSSNRPILLRTVWLYTS